MFDSFYMQIPGSRESIQIDGFYDRIVYVQLDDAPTSYMSRQEYNLGVFKNEICVYKMQGRVIKYYKLCISITESEFFQCLNSILHHTSHQLKQTTSK